VLDAATGWLLELVASTFADAGTLPPLILPTVVALCVPVKSPLRLPVKLAALVALVAFATAVDPIALTICAPVAATGADPIEK
jgi:Na+/H+ antiporter NhaC